MAGMFEELYTDPLDQIEQSARQQAALGSWGTIAAASGLAGGMLGRAGSKALGATYEDDLVNEIFKQGDFETEEGRDKILADLAAVSPSAHLKASEIFTKLETDRLELKAKRGLPSKSAYYRTSVEPNVIREFATDAGIPGDIKSYADFSNALDALVSSGQMKTGERSSKKESLKRFMKESKQGWMDLNKYKTMDQITGMSGNTATVPSSTNVTGMASKVEGKPKASEMSLADKSIFNTVAVNQGYKDYLRDNMEMDPNTGEAVYPRISKEEYFRDNKEQFYTLFGIK